MRPWLYSPAVALVGFVASVLTLGQMIFAVARAACQWASHADASRYRRVSILAVLASLVALAVVGPLSWSAIMAEAHKVDSGFTADLEAVALNLCSFAAAMVMWDDATSGRRFSWRTFGLFSLGLPCEVTIWILHNTALGWTKYAAVAIVAAPVMMFLLAMLDYEHKANNRIQASNS